MMLTKRRTSSATERVTRHSSNKLVAFSGLLSIMRYSFF
jgi:hypothetical protein